MTIYLDMDGVLADFFKGLEDYYDVEHWKQIPDIENSIRSLKNTDFFYQLRPFETTARLINYVLSTGDDWGICSSPLRDDFANSSYWKRRWLEDYDIAPAISKMIFTNSKHKFATNKIDGTPNILIDDKPSNIAEWELHGGIGIRYQANQDDFEEYLLPAIDEAIDLADKVKFV